MLVLDINERKMFKALLIGTIALILLHIINELVGKPSWQITRLIWLGHESTIATWFSSMLFFIAAFFAYQCSLVFSLKSEAKRMWCVCSLILLVLSCDEVAQMHEYWGAYINEHFFKLKGIEHASWIVIIPFFLVGLLLFISKFKKYLFCSAKAMKFLALGTVMFIAGAFILEATINFLNHGNLEWVWKIEIVLEEACEMFGVLLIVKGLMETHKGLRQA